MARRRVRGRPDDLAGPEKRAVVAGAVAAALVATGYDGQDKDELILAVTDKVFGEESKTLSIWLADKPKRLIGQLEQAAVRGLNAARRLREFI